MPALEYLTFDLLVEKSGDGYRARVVDSPAGQASAQFAPLFRDDELAEFLARVGGRGAAAGAGKPEDLVKQFGARFFDAVFNNEVLTGYRRSRDAADREGKGLRVKLRLNDVPELADLPWEYLYDRTRQNFLALSKETPIVRFLELPEPVTPLTAPAPLNLLVVLASPSDYQELDVEGEWARLNDALKELRAQNQVTLTRVRPATLDALRAQLRKEAYHVLHFIGHGEYDPARQQGALIFVDDTGRGRTVSDERVAILLHDAPALRVVLLNACEGARTSAGNPFAGVAPRLVQQGIPAVLAMQFPISDPAALQFSSEFYRTLADGYPVDAAVNEGRRGVYFEGGALEWGTPVLFMRAPDGVVFQQEDAMSDSQSEKDNKEKRSQNAAIEFSGGTNYISGDLVAGNVYGDKYESEGDINIVNIGAGAQVGQVAAGKNITQTQGVSGQDLAVLFRAVYQKIDARPDDPNVDKDEIKSKVKQIESESAKGDKANPQKVERWLRDLKNIAPDILEVTAAALLNPIAGVATAIRKIAERVRG